MDPEESHMGGEPVNKANKSIFEVFKALGNDLDTKRNEACILLIQHLAESATKNTEENGLFKDLNYSLKRLVRGLGAPSRRVQEGSFVALVSVLHSHPIISYEIFHDAVEKELHCSHKGSKGEEGEVLLGRCLALGAAFRSGLFSRSTRDQQKTMLTTVIDSAKKKSYLPFITSSFILDLLSNTSEKEFSEAVWPLLKEEVLKPWKDQTLDTLLMLLTLQVHHPEVLKSKHMQKWLNCNQLLAKDTMKHFAERLVSTNSAVNARHPLLQQFCETLCIPDNSALLDQFWVVDVEKELCSSTRSKELSALHILIYLLNNLQNKDQVEKLMTTRVLHIVSRILGAPRVNKEHDPELHKAASQVLSLLSKILTADDVSDKTCSKILHKILFSSGDLQYEKQTGTRIVKLLEGKLKLKGVQKLAKKFREVVTSPLHSNETSWANKDRKYAAQQLARLLGHPACLSEVDWVVEQLMFLARCGLFKDVDSSKSIGTDLAVSLRKCFFSALDQKFSSLEKQIQILGKLISLLDELILKGAHSGVELRVPLNSQELGSWKMMMKITSSLEKKNSNTNGKGSAEQFFYPLFLHMGLQLLADPSMAQEGLEELHSCYSRLQSGGHGHKKKEEPQWVEVAVDLLLSLLSRDSHLHRTVVASVFPHLCKHLTVSSFCQILEVLDPEQNRNPLSSSQDVEEDDSESELSSEDLDTAQSLNKNHSLKKAENENNSAESSDSEDEANDNSNDDNDDDDDDDNEDDDDDDEDDLMENDEETVNDKLRMEIGKALGNSASLTDTESVDLDDLDEEEGHRMDMALAQAFKSLRQSRSNKKNNKKQLKSEEAVTHFRLRVLDLVELYISRDPCMSLCLEAIAPLFSLLIFCMKDAHQKPLESRVKNVIRKLTSVRKFSSVEGVDESRIAEQLKELAAKGTKTQALFLGTMSEVTECCTFLVRCSENLVNHAPKKSQEKPDLVVDVFRVMLSDFFIKRDTLLPIALFKSVLQLQWNGCWELAPLVLKHAFDSSVRPFRCAQALELLLVFFRNNHLLSSATHQQKKVLRKIEMDLSRHTIEIVNNSISGDSSQARPRNQFIVLLLQLLVQMISRGDGDTIDKDALVAALSSFCENIPGVTSQTKKMLTALSRKLNFSVGPLKKSKNVRNTTNGDLQDEDITSETKEQETRKKKKKKHQTPGLSEPSHMNGIAGQKKETERNVPQGKVKKQKKIERLAMMGEGLESVSFSAFDHSAMNGMDSDEKEEVSHYSKNTVENNSSNMSLPNGNSQVKHKKRKKTKSLSHDVDVNSAKKKKGIL